MQRFHNILVLFDRATGSREALDRAAALAARNGARLGLLVCLTEFDRADTRGKLQEIVIRGLRGHFNTLVEPLRDRGIAVCVEVGVGRPFVEAIRMALRHDYDLLVKTAESAGRHGFRFGSTDLHLLRKCPRPVWLFRKRPEPAAGGVLAAISPAPPGSGGEALNIRILELAAALARQHRQPLHVAQGWAPPDPMLLRWLGWRGELAGGLAGELAGGWQELERQREQAAARFNAVVDRIVSQEIGQEIGQEIAVHRHFVDGIAADVLARLVEANAIDVIVMATLTRTGVPGLLIGETAEDVLRRIDCSVLAVKPDGFVSPVAA